MSDDEFGFDDAAFAEQHVELLVFQIGPQRFAADATLIVRIDRPDEDTPTRDELGPLSKGARALIFRAPGDIAEGSLRVDLVHGVKTIESQALRRLPPAATRKDSCSIGIWLDGAEPVLLVDLLQTLKSAPN